MYEIKRFNISRTKLNKKDKNGKIRTKLDKKDKTGQKGQNRTICTKLDKIGHIEQNSMKSKIGLH